VYSGARIARPLRYFMLDSGAGVARSSRYFTQYKTSSSCSCSGYQLLIHSRHSELTQCNFHVLVQVTIADTEHIFCANPVQY
jgi:hypothetical protein